MINIRIVFMGTPEFACPSLEALINHKYEVCLCLCQPDKLVGRKQTLTEPAVKIVAKKYNIPVLQPNTLKDENIYNIIKNEKPDLIVVAAYGKILTKSILYLPKHGAINVHGSLLPEYRGASPIQMSIINGAKKTGITIMHMEEGLDSGDIILQKEVLIPEDATSGEMFKKMAELGAKCLINAIKLIERKEATRISQDETLVTFAPIIKKEMAKIDWRNSANVIHNLVRGMNPWPIAYTILNKKNLKIYKAQWFPADERCFFQQNGQVINLTPLIIFCGNNEKLVILELQLEGKKRMLASEFVNGNNIKLGDILL